MAHSVVSLAYANHMPLLRLWSASELEWWLDLTFHLSSTHHTAIFYTVSEKSIPDIFNCNLKTNYQILLIFGKNIPDTTCHQFSFPSHPTFVSALPGKAQPAKYHFFIQDDIIA